MALEFLVPVSTEVIEPNPACVTGGECRDGILLVYLVVTSFCSIAHWDLAS
jgi:hypothetical protein